MSFPVSFFTVIKLLFPSKTNLRDRDETPKGPQGLHNGNPSLVNDVKRHLSYKTVQNSRVKST